MTKPFMLENIKTICAVGAGAMGAGTALCFAMAGYDIRLYDLTEDALKLGMDKISASLESFCANGLVEKSQIPTILARIKTTTDLEQAGASADFVIESIVENLAIKQKLFSSLDKICPPHTIFATNTSGLSPTDIAEAITRKDKFVVTHFWNPPQLIPLVEVVPGKHTSQETMDVAFQLIEKIGKKPVLLKKESLGFVGNRLQLALLREAFHIVESGIASPADVDTVVRNSLGLRYSVTGPFESIDLGGLDIFWNIFSYLGADLGKDTGIPSHLQHIVEQGNLGAKTGSGIYNWPADRLAAIREKRENTLLDHLKKETSR